MPIQCQQASVTHGRGTISVTNVCPRNTTFVSQPRASTFQHFVDKQPTTTTWAFHQLRFNDLQGIVKALQTGSLDEPDTAELCTSAWKLCCGKAYIEGCNFPPGEAPIHNAYRGELAGIYACIRMVNLLCVYYDITGSVTVGCDNEQALRQIQKNHIHTQATTQHGDLVQFAIGFRLPRFYGRQRKLKHTPR